MQKQKAQRERIEATGGEYIPVRDSDSKTGTSAPKLSDVATTPEATTDGYSPLLVAYHKKGNQITEQYRSLRVHLQAHFADKPFALMVTSAQAGEGKTVTCLNLAFMLGKRGDHRTLILDADLRKPTIRGLLKHKRKPGLADLLRGEAKLEDIILPTTYPRVSVIHAGTIEADGAGELLASNETSDVLKKLREQYDHLLVDTPAVNAVPDACLLGRSVPDALMVVRMNKTRRDAVDVAMERFNAIGVNIAGLVLTHQQSGSRNKNHYYNKRY